MDRGRKRLHEYLKKIIIELIWDAYTEKQILDLVRRYYKSGIKEWEENAVFFREMIGDIEND